MAKHNQALEAIPTKIMESLATSPMLQALALEPHQLMIASEYLRQENPKNLKTAFESVSMHCPAGYDPNEDTKLTMFLVDYEVIVRGASLFSNHVLYAEAYRQYLRAVAMSDQKLQLFWFDRLEKISGRIGTKEAAPKRKITI